MIEREERCGDDYGDDDCPICWGEVSDEFVAMIQRAVAEPGRVMTFDEAMAWLRDIDAGSSHPG